MDSDLKFVSSLIEKIGRQSLLMDSLGLRAREVISLVGAGGKTTFMFRLAGELVKREKKVVTTTTTKILEPNPGETSVLFIDPDEKKIAQFIRDSLGESRHITVATERLDSGKLSGIPPSLIESLCISQKIDFIIVEADGAAGRPIKAPREGEPVIPWNTTLVVAILGVDGIGVELREEKVFRSERASQITGVPIGERITDEAIATLITCPEGIIKGAPSSSRVIVFLNKVDSPRGIEKAKALAQKILAKKHPQIERVVLGQLKNDPPVIEVIFPQGCAQILRVSK